jgi:hypothetical protein
MKTYIPTLKIYIFIWKTYVRIWKTYIKKWKIIWILFFESGYFYWKSHIKLSYITILMGYEFFSIKSHITMCFTLKVFKSRYNMDQVVQPDGFFYLKFGLTNVFNETKSARFPASFFFKKQESVYVIVEAQNWGCYSTKIYLSLLLLNLLLWDCVGVTFPKVKTNYKLEIWSCLINCVWPWLLFLDWAWAPNLEGPI